MAAKIAFVLRVDRQLVADLVAEALIGGEAELAYVEPAAGDTTMVLTAM